ncbi:MAG: integrase [Gammaproteobacteria bacterium]|nr:integrase [Gammaproteobacteria bacterium]
MYTAADIRLLAAAGEIGGQLCGPAACAVLRREYEVFGDARFERLSRLSPSHLYNLRRSKTYRTRRTTFRHTRPTTVRIGERRRPEPDGKPGHVRVDTVHQGDRDRVKGIYHINLIDEVTQFEHLGAVATISEAFLVPILEEMLATLPFVVVGFHADNGSEYVNRTVVAMLNKPHVPNFTKSRARRSNDNALVEGKNASVVRKWFGHDHIPQRFAPEEVNAFSRDVLTPHLNYHHPCLFATEIRDGNGKVRRRYRRRDVATPYEKLKSLPDAERFLKPGVTFAELDQVALAMSGLEANRARDELLRTIAHANVSVA